jgi:hypothetical protein
MSEKDMAQNQSQVTFKYVRIDDKKLVQLAANMKPAIIELAKV